jgi:F-type H+-transporting ATPase subunit epsilon
MKEIALTILTPHGLAYEGEVEEVYVPTSKGPLGVLPGHTPYIAVLAEAGVCHFRTADKKEHYFALRYGSLEVKSDKTIVLSDVALAADTLEKAQSLLLSSPIPAYKKGASKEKEGAKVVSPTSPSSEKPYNKAK